MVDTGDILNIRKAFGQHFTSGSLQERPNGLFVYKTHVIFKSMYGTLIELPCGAVDLDPLMAELKALSEGVERMSLGTVTSADIKYSNVDDIQRNIVNPKSFPRYTEAQVESEHFPFHIFQKDMIIGWTTMTDLLSGNRLDVPASLVFVPYQVKDSSQNEVPLFQPVSSGAACHTDLQSAVMNGLLEILERDAVALTWQTIKKPFALRKEILDDPWLKVFDELQAGDREVYLSDISLDHLVPIAMAILIDRSGKGPALRVGAGAALKMQDAAQKALGELVMMDQVEVSGNNNNVSADFIDQLKYWNSVEYLPQAEFLWEGLSPSQRKDEETDLFELSRRLNARGYDVLVKDLTIKAGQEANMHVVKVLVPGMWPISSGYEFRCLEGTRIVKFLDPDQSDNPVPNPFT